MKHINLYQCEICEKFRDEDPYVVEAHEAAHLGLSVEEKHLYDSLRSFVAYIDNVADKQKVKPKEWKDNDTEKITRMCKQAHDNLEKFKIEHNLD